MRLCCRCVSIGKLLIRKMSGSVGRRIFTHFCESHLKKLSTRSNVFRFRSTCANDKLPNLEDNTKAGVPACETEKLSAAVLKKFSEPLVIENVAPVKSLQTNQVLIDVQYCALNGPDILLAKNLHTSKPNLPMVLGYELVGKLVKVGEEAQKQGYKEGDKVIALNREHYGGLTEQCVAGVNDIWKVPSSIKSLDAVSLLDNYINALVALERKVSIQEEDIILINVGTSGIGLAAVDLATNVFRAQVLSVCATEDGAALAREKGVLASFKYKDSKLLKQIEEVAADKEIKDIFTDADGDYLKKVLKCFTNVYKDGAPIADLFRDDNFAVVVHHLSREGRAIIAGTVKTMAKTDSEDQENVFSVTGFDLQEYKKQNLEAYRQAGDDVLEFFEEGLIKPTQALTVGLHNVNDAVEFIVNSKTSGKVIVDIRNKESKAEKIGK